MAFDRTDPADLAALKSEVNTDPIAMGYAPVVEQTALLLDKLNLAANNVGGDTINKPTEELSIPEVAEIIDATEYDALSAYDKVWVEMFINRARETALSDYQGKFLSVFGAGSATRTAALALRAKAASRAEVLFGVNTVISRQDWIAARDS